MREYYLKICESPDDDMLENDWIMINELPFQQMILKRLAALGIINIQRSMISADQIERVAKILRLRQFLKVNLSGAAIICELLDRLEEQEDEIEKFKRNNHQGVGDL